MVTTICWSTEDRVDYALEGVIVSCGATIEWLKNELNLFNDSKETEAMAMLLPDNGGVYLNSCIQRIRFAALANGQKSIYYQE